MTRRLAILAQFDPSGSLPSHVQLHLEGLRPVVQRLVLVSNSPLDPASLGIAETLCDRVLQRPNIGWDFAGWRDVLATEPAKDFDHVILTNSSVVGPLFPLGPIFDRMEALDPDLWGMVETYNKGRHLQSYFLSASARVVASQAWAEFWGSVIDYEDKDYVIRKYEVGFSQAMTAAGFDLLPMIKTPKFPESIALVDIERLKVPLRVPFSVNYINRTVRFHEDLIRRGMPYLKASLLHGKDVSRFVGLDRIRAIPEVNFPFEQLKVELP